MSALPQNPAESATDSRASSETTLEPSTELPSPSVSRVSSIGSSRASTLVVTEYTITPKIHSTERSRPSSYSSRPRFQPTLDNNDTFDSEEKRRIYQLKRDILDESNKSPQRSSQGLFKSVCSTDLLFLIDTTGSMGASIEAAKQQVRSIVADIKMAFLNEATVRVAVVGYKDHCDVKSVQFLDFTESTDAVHLFLDQLVATGGGDLPEDVLGGIKKAINASWRQQTRCIIHIGDAPAHGRNLQNSEDDFDTYPRPGTEPHRLTYEPLLRKMIALKINYCFLRIWAMTDCMIFKFLKFYADAGAECKLHTLNRFYQEACSISEDFRSDIGRGKGSAKGGLIFEEAELGVEFDKLKHLVVKMVTTSASRTAVRASTSTTRTDKKGFAQKLKSLGSIEEDEDDLDDAKMDSSLPQWDRLDWFNETLAMEGFSPDMVVHNANTLDDMMADDNNIMMSITKLTVHKRSKPFAQGALRVASHCRTAGSTNRFVVKSFKKGGKRLAHVAEDMRCQALCKAFALEFNALLGEEHSIDFIVTTCLKGRGGRFSSDECMSLEPFIEGKYVKYNNNCGWVNEYESSNQFNEAAQAFSHFTFEKSRGRLLVCDLQGVGRIFTDPAIHSLDKDRFRLADTNLGQEGFKFFFATHVCNKLCSELGLKSTSATFAFGTLEFREEWPSMDDTVCCSNKLCGKIIRVAHTKSSDEFPGYHWCEICFPQLNSSKAEYTCETSDQKHEYEASRFFLESQGQDVPSTCPKHRVEEVFAERNIPAEPAAVSGCWSRFKFASRRPLFGRN